MNFCLALLFAICAISFACCSEINVCHVTTHKSVVSHKTHIWKYRSSGGGLIVNMFSYPTRHKVKIRKRECCDGHHGYVKGRGCLLYSPCNIILPQHATSHCRKKRDTQLTENRLYYRLTTPKDLSDTSRLPTDILTPLLNQSEEAIRNRAFFDPLEAEWANYFYYAMRQSFFKMYLGALQTFGVKQFTTVAEFAQLRSYFYEGVKAINSPKIYYKTDMFLDLVTNNRFMDDEIFAAQRLVGSNILTLRKVTTRDDVGTKWSELKAHLNPSFNWEEAVKVVTGLSIDDSISKGRLFVCDEKLARGLPTPPDAFDTNLNDTRVMDNVTAPVGLFATKMSDKGSLELYPVAIQLDYEPDSKVKVPSDGEEWKLAKYQFETTDFMVGQIGYHLQRTHFMMDRICVTANRQFSTFHPFGQIFSRHCVGTMLVNGNGVPALVKTGGAAHRATSIGHIGGIELLNRMFADEDWEQHDFLLDLKRRGVDNIAELPYNPYRDDGMLIHAVMKRFVSEYVDMYYESDEDVLNDARLQEFCDELSLHGSKGQNAGVGKLKGFPSHIATISLLKKTLLRILFVIPIHSAISFPLAEFVMLAPSTPLKLYTDTTRNLTAFECLPDSSIASYTNTLVGTLASLHYDTLLDYGAKLTEFKARKLVEKYHAELNQIIGPIIKKRVHDRLSNNQFGYPYFLPDFMPNSIST